MIYDGIFFVNTSQKKESKSLTCSLFSTKSVLTDGINPTIVG